jgi:hypothetical protein
MGDSGSVARTDRSQLDATVTRRVPSLETHPTYPENSGTK